MGEEEAEGCLWTAETQIFLSQGEERPARSTGWRSNDDDNSDKCHHGRTQRESQIPLIAIGHKASEGAAQAQDKRNLVKEGAGEDEKENSPPWEESQFPLMGSGEGKKATPKLKARDGPSTGETESGKQEECLTQRQFESPLMVRGRTNKKALLLPLCVPRPRTYEELSAQEEEGKGGQEEHSPPRQESQISLMTHDAKKKNKESKEKSTTQRPLNEAWISPGEPPSIPFKMTKERVDKDRKQSKPSKQGEKKKDSKRQKVFDQLTFADREAQIPLMAHDRRKKNDESTGKPIYDEGDGEEAWVGPGELSRIPFETTTKPLEELETKVRKQSKPREQGEKKKCSKPQKVFDNLTFADCASQTPLMARDGRKGKKWNLNKRLTAQREEAWIGSSNAGNAEEAWISPAEPRPIPFEKTKELSDKSRKQSKPIKQGEKKKDS